MRKHELRADDEEVVMRNARVALQLQAVAEDRRPLEDLDVPTEVKAQLASAAGLHVLQLWLKAYKSSIVLLVEFADLLSGGPTPAPADTRALARGSNEMLQALYRRLGQLSPV